MRQTVFLASFLLAIYLVIGQQYVPVYFPINFNQSRPGYVGWPPKYNYSNSYNNGNNNYRPPIINQFPNYYPKFNFSRYVAYNTSSGAYNGTQDGHLFLGQIQMYDRLLFSQSYRKESRWWTSRDKIIEYPSANAPRLAIISAIRIYNQFLDGNTSRASIKKGGVGYTYVKIYLESGWNKGFQYLVQIYGH